MQTHKWDGDQQSQNKKEVASKSVFVLEAVEMNGDFALSQGREEAFSLILSSPEVGGALCQEELLFTPTCRHGTFEAFVKRGIWQRATRVLSFTNSSLRDDNARSGQHLPL